MWLAFLLIELEDESMKKRRVRFVEKFQLRLAIRMLVYWFVYQLTLWNIMFCWYMFRNGPGNLLEQYGKFTAEYYPILLSFLVLVPPIIWDAVKFCHRVGGPIYRVRMTMLDFADGAPWRTIQFRKGDELPELEEAFNRMVKAMQEREEQVSSADDRTEVEVG